MKRFIVIISAFFCLSIAQDIAGSWTLTAVDVWYYNFARPNAATADEAFGEYQYESKGDQNWEENAILNEG